jgi:hypothetical protein
MVTITAVYTKIYHKLSTSLNVPSIMGSPSETVKLMGKVLCSPCYLQLPKAVTPDPALVKAGKVKCSHVLATVGEALGAKAHGAHSRQGSKGLL